MVLQYDTHPECEGPGFDSPLRHWFFQTVTNSDPWHLVANVNSEQETCQSVRPRFLLGGVNVMVSCLSGLAVWHSPRMRGTRVRFPLRHWFFQIVTNSDPWHYLLQNRIHYIRWCTCISLQCSSRQLLYNLQCLPPWISVADTHPQKELLLKICWRLYSATV